MKSNFFNSCETLSELRRTSKHASWNDMFMTLLPNQCKISVCNLNTFSWPSTNNLRIYFQLFLHKNATYIWPVLHSRDIKSTLSGFECLAGEYRVTNFNMPVRATYLTACACLQLKFQWESSKYTTQASNFESSTLDVYIHLLLFF